MKLQNDVVHGTWDYPFQIHHTNLQDGLYLYPHIHNEFEITVITNGQGIFCVNGQEYRCKTGDIIIMEPLAIHLAYAIDNEPASFFSIVFADEYISCSQNSRIYRKYVAPVVNQQVRLITYIDQSENWHKDVLKLAKELERLAFVEDSEMLCQSKLLELWDTILKNGTVWSDDKWDDRDINLKKSMVYMHENYSLKITVSDLAKIAHMSEGHFTRVFHAYMKTSPMEYLIHVRIYEATKKLISEAMRISEIALSCGFNDFSYFGQQFKKRMGMTPREYRKAFAKHNEI